MTLGFMEFDHVTNPYLNSDKHFKMIPYFLNTYYIYNFWCMEHSIWWIYFLNNWWNNWWPWKYSFRGSVCLEGWASGFLDTLVSSSRLNKASLCLGSVYRSEINTLINTGINNLKHKRGDENQRLVQYLPSLPNFFLRSALYFNFLALCIIRCAVLESLKPLQRELLKSFKYKMYSINQEY